MNQDLFECDSQAMRIARAAGALLLGCFRQIKTTEAQKKGRRNLVTVADTQSEELIRRELEAAFPGKCRTILFMVRVRTPMISWLTG